MREHASRLLEWYDRHARSMPWRVPPAARMAGQRPDPYAVWLSEIMLQQTTVVTVGPYFHKFYNRWPTVGALAAADDADVMAAWAGLGYYARARNLIKCARAVVADHGGAFPTTEAGLRTLPGIGPYTAAAVAAIAFDEPATVLDGNVERVMARMFAVENPLPDAKETLRGHARQLTPTTRAGDYAQAVMDLGATICTPRRPACGLCPWRGDCTGQATGIAETLPRKRPKPEKPTRLGTAYFLRRRADRAVLLERRPDKGLLGGMLGLPGTAWAEKAPTRAEPVAADWRILPGAVRHTFTHFHLVLDLAVAETSDAPGTFYPPDAARGEDLPTVMRKAFRLGHSALD